MKLPISVFIITKDEEEHIEKTLQSVSLLDEVILVDSGSSDDTLKIAKRYGAKFILTHGKAMQSKNNTQCHFARMSGL